MIAALSILLCLADPVEQPAGKVKIPAHIEKFLAHEDGLKNEEIKRLQGEFAARVATEKTSKRPALQQEFAALIASMDDRGIVKELRWPLKHNDLGRCSLYTAVLQVLDQTTHLAVINQSIFMVKQMSTEGMADDEKRPLQKTIWVSGTESYTDVSGAKRTVKVIEVIDEKEVDKYRAAWRADHPLPAVALKIPGNLPDIPDDPPQIAKTKKTADPEAVAASRLKLAKQLMGKNDAAAKQRLKEIVEQYPETASGKEAEKLLKK